jgi:hypothetical protein
LFNILKGLTKAVVGVATLPVDVAADVITLGGALNDKEQPYTAKKLGKIMDALDEATD